MQKGRQTDRQTHTPRDASENNTRLHSILARSITNGTLPVRCRLQYY